MIEPSLEPTSDNSNVYQHSDEPTNKIRLKFQRGNTANATAMPPEHHHDKVRYNLLCSHIKETGMEIKEGQRW